MLFQDFTEIPLDDEDARRLPALQEYFRSFWSDTSEEPRAKYNKFIANTPMVDHVVFRPATPANPPGLWCEPTSVSAQCAILYLHGGAHGLGSADAYPAVTFSPWTDLTLSGRSVREKAQKDVLLVPASLAEAAQAYAGAFPLSDPRASPLFGIPGEMPPLLIQVGSDEILLDDSLRYAAQARQIGASIMLEVWEGMHHVFQLDVRTLATSRRSLDRAAAFLVAGN